MKNPGVSGASGSAERATAQDIRRLCGDLDDETVAQMLATGASLAELEQAVIYAEGQGENLARTGHPLSGNVARIVEILAADEEWADRER